MSIQQFHAATSREALAKARAAFGDSAVILSNRPAPHGGVEVTAASEETLAQLGQTVAPAHESALAMRAAAAPSFSRAMESAERRSGGKKRDWRQEGREERGSFSQAAAQRVEPVFTETTPAEDAERLTMSTLSFQDYVRERLLRRRHEERRQQSEESRRAAVEREDDRPKFSMREEPQEQRQSEVRKVTHPGLQAAGAINVGASNPRPYAIVPPDPLVARKFAPDVQESFIPQAQANGHDEVVDHLKSELDAMKDLIEERFSTLAWLGQAKHNPVRANLTLKLIRAGYSPQLARSVLERMPEDAQPAEAMRWMLSVLERNLKTDENAKPLHESGGIFALVGATGVGKTTTAAKLAAQCAALHGAGSVGLVTLDSYHVGAHEQLRAFARMIGQVAHVAHDREALQDLLGLLANRKMVIIDTCGVAPRDPRKQEMLDILDLPQVRRLLVLNAANHGDAQDEAVAAFSTGEKQQTVLTKADEAVKLGPTLDAVIRHRLLLRGVSNGQRVPEDWTRAVATELVRQSMRVPGRSVHEPRVADLDLYFAPSGQERGQRDWAKDRIDA